MARFNFNSKCAHPRKCVRLMTEFLQDATTMTYAQSTLNGNSNSNGNDKAARKIKLVKIAEVNFCAFIYDSDNTKIKIGYNFKTLTGTVLSNFNRVFYLKSRSFMGFSSLTLSLLHELGHFETLDHVPKNYDRVTSVKAILKTCTDKKGNKDLEKANLMYFSLPDEWLATQWAADWLANFENRKKAKAFEKAFFEAWRG